MCIFSYILNNLNTEVAQLLVWCSSIPVYAFVFISVFVSCLFLSTSYTFIAVVFNLIHSPFLYVFLSAYLHR
jgi:hypothetical protein